MGGYILKIMKPHFKAKLEFFPSEKSGRKTEVYSGYQPLIEFYDFPEYFTSGHQDYLGKTSVEMGEKVMANINIVSVEYFTGQLYVGMKFRFCESPTDTIGIGEIIELF